MKRFGLLRSLAPVGMIVFTLGAVGAGAQNQAAPSQGSAGPNVAPVPADQWAAQQDRLQCIGLQKEIAEAKTTFLGTCKEERFAGINNKDPEKAKKAEEECMKDFNTCRETADAEISFEETMVSSVFKGMGAENPVIQTPTSRRCSKYGLDKLNSMIDKAQSSLDTKKRDHKDAIEKQQRDEESYTEKSARLQEEFIKDQEEKAKAEIESKESARDRQAAFDKQKSDYEERLRKLDQDIFKAQQQLTLMAAQRGSEVNSYKAAMIKCKKDLREYSKTMNTNMASGLSRAGKRASDRNSELKTLWDACADQALRNRIAEADKYKAAVETINNDIQLKNQEIAALRTSLQKLTAMFNQAAQEQALHNQKMEEAFMKKQAQKFQQVQALDQQMQQKRIANQKLIADAQSAINAASNKLNTLENEDAVSEKSREELGKEILKSRKSQETFDLYCKNGAASKGSSSQPGTSSPSPAGPGAK